MCFLHTNLVDSWLYRVVCDSHVSVGMLVHFSTYLGWYNLDRFGWNFHLTQSTKIQIPGWNGDGFFILRHEVVHTFHRQVFSVQVWAYWAMEFWDSRLSWFASFSDFGVVWPFLSSTRDKDAFDCSSSGDDTGPGNVCWRYSFTINFDCIIIILAISLMRLSGSWLVEIFSCMS